MGLPVGFFGTQRVATLDDYSSGQEVLYGLKKLRNAYGGSCLKVRRSSDNATQDIGFAASGLLDSVAMLSFVGANNGFIDTWYDQATGANHMAQATTGKQPQIVASGAFDGFITWDNSNDVMTSASNVTGGTTKSLFWYGYTSNGAPQTNDLPWVIAGAVNFYGIYTDPTTFTLASDTGPTSVPYTSDIGTSLAGRAVVFDNALSGKANQAKYYVGASQITAAVGGSGTSYTTIGAGKLWLGSNPAESLPTALKIKGFVLYTDAKSGAAVTAINSLMGAY